jgi:hypothetical protein
MILSPLLSSSLLLLLLLLLLLGSLESVGEGALPLENSNNDDVEANSDPEANENTENDVVVDHHHHHHHGGTNEHAQKKVRHGDDGLDADEVEKLKNLGIESMVGEHFGDANEYPGDNPDESFKNSMTLNKNNNDEDNENADDDDNDNDNDDVQDEVDDEQQGVGHQEKQVESTSLLSNPWALIGNCYHQHHQQQS